MGFSVLNHLNSKNTSDINAPNVTQVPMVVFTAENYIKLANQLKDNFYQNVAMQDVHVNIGWMKGI